MKENTKSLDEKIPVLITGGADLEPRGDPNKVYYISRREIRDYNRFRAGILSVILLGGFLYGMYKSDFSFKIFSEKYIDSFANGMSVMGRTQ